MSLYQLAVALKDVAAKADENWTEGEAMSKLITLAAIECCQDQSERDLVCILLSACWNDALAWAEEQDKP